jgi:lipopolysaccharide transport system permease protein
VAGVSAPACATVVAQTILIATMLAPFRVLISHRQAIQIFVNRDIRGRYINSALGLWWAVIQPLALLALYTFVFSSVMSIRLSASGTTSEFALYAFCGLLPWLAVADALTRSSSILLDQTPLIKKVVFPTEILPIHLVLSALIVEIVGLVVFLVVVMIGGRLPGWSLLTLPLVMAVQFLFMTGIAWLLSTLALYLRDVRQVVGLVLTLWMFLTPIVYPASLVPARFQWVLDINPMTAIVDAYRAALLDDRMPALLPLVLFTVVAVTVFVAGYWVFMRSKPTFADLL